MAHTGANPVKTFFIARARTVCWHWGLVCTLTVIIGSSTLYANPENTSTATLHQSYAHLAALKQSLQRAEQLPGQHGLDQVRHYQHQIEELENKLNVSDATFAQDYNAPWTLDRESGSEGAHQPSRSPVDGLQEERRKISLKLDWLTQQIDMPGVDKEDIAQRMTGLLKRQNRIDQRLKDLEAHPYPVLAAIEQQKEKRLTLQDQQNHSPQYVALLQEQLQGIYQQIFHLRNEILRATLGTDIRHKGEKIAALEVQERLLKDRLHAMGVPPEKPRILSSNTPNAPMPTKDPHTLFDQSVRDQMHLIDQKLDALKSKIATATSGNELASLGAQMDILQHQRLLLAHDLKETPIPAQKLIDTAPIKDSPTHWGTDAKAPPFFQIPQQEKPLSGESNPGHHTASSPQRAVALQPKESSSKTLTAAESAPTQKYKLWDTTARGMGTAQNRPTLTTPRRSPQKQHKPDFLQALNRI